MSFISWIYIDPNREAFRLPLIQHPIAWYGILFACGFLGSYFVVRLVFCGQFQKHMGKKEAKARAFHDAERFSWYIILGALIGSRLFHVFFYDWPIYRENLFEILKVWHGGLASHGGVIGAVCATALYAYASKGEKGRLTFYQLIDALAISAPFAGGCIRLGNFINQEILGTPSTLPWAIVFGHPADGSFPEPRHPVQLYESLFYFLLFGCMLLLWHAKKTRWPQGRYAGICLLATFLFRFWVENMKVSQGVLISEKFLSMGQWLSFPLLGFALFLLLRKGREAVAKSDRA